MNIIAIDPGHVESAWIDFDGKRVHGDKVKNEELLHFINSLPGPGVMVIEQVACMGMAVGAEVFETVFWSGRFCQAWRGRWERLKRHEVKMHLCGNMRAKDANIRQALIDRFGPSKEAAVGLKKCPGPLYSVKGDMWSALAVAVTWHDKHIVLGAA